MSSEANDAEELKSLASNQLASIVWPLRTPREKPLFQQEFLQHIRDKFNETDPTRFSREVQEFGILRNSAISCLSSTLRDTSSLKALKKYYCQLASMVTRFRDSSAEFPWRDSFGRTITSGNIEFELNNIMYNIAAIHNEIGAKITRNNESANREACQQYSSALWWVTELRDNRAGLKNKEMGHDLLTFYHHVLKGQAQECVLFYSLTTGMRPENLAKISSQIASDFEVAVKLVQTPLYADPLKDIMTGASTLQNWRATVSFKQKYYLASSHLFQALTNSDDSAKEIGARISHIQFASARLEECKKLLPDCIDSQGAKLAFEKLNNLVTKKLDRAKSFNNSVYHSPVPDLDSLPKIESKLVVSAAPFSISSVSDFYDLFSQLVTIESIEVISLYSERKDKISRDIKSKVEKHDQDLVHMMSTLNIDKQNLRLPPIEESDQLVELCAELSMNPNIVDDVLTKLEELDEKSDEMQKMLEAAKIILSKCPNRDCESELKRYEAAHQDVLKTIASLHNQMSPELMQKIQRMATTSNPLELLPSTADFDSIDEDGVVRKLHKLLSSIDSLKMERVNLLDQLKKSLDDDDVIKHVVAAASEQELKGVFDKEIQKHDAYLKPLANNLTSQNEYLDALEKLNAEYGQLKLNHRAKRSAQSERVETMKKFYNQFKATSEGIEQGLDYYKNMLELVRKFHQKVRSNYDLQDLLN